MLKKILPFLICTPCLGGTIEVVSSNYSFDTFPEYQAVMAQLKVHGHFEDMPLDDDKEKLRRMTKGERAVEEAKARNRAILIARNKKEEGAPKEKTTLEEWRSEQKETFAMWKAQERESLAQWKREQDIFLGRLKIYKENTFRLPVKEEKITEKKLPREAIPNVHIVNQAFSVPVRDQGNRATCVAFAATRAMEIILQQNGRSEDISEQYLYWAGKPKCQKSPCAEKGSWIRETFAYSKQRPVVDIPAEVNCSYQASPMENNETQIPLSPGCLKGEVKVDSFEEVLALADVVEKIKKDIPVVIAAKLTENFYLNKGLVTHADAVRSIQEHSRGHALLAVGVIELPLKLRPTEGNYCILVANSWGKGWGAGGHSCLTERWLEVQRQPSPFFALSRISSK